MTGLVSKQATGLKGTAKVPGDKSISHRALMLGALASGETVVSGLLEGEDVMRTAKALISMCVNITPPDVKGGIWRIEGLGKNIFRSPRGMLYLGNSGTSARLLMGVVGGYPVSAVFSGDPSLSRRPMGRVIKPLAQMGVRFEMSSADRLPLRVTGSSMLRPIHYPMPVASAQVKSAILLAGLHAEGKTTVVEPQPSRDHTERMLSFMGAEVSAARNQDGTSVIALQGFPHLKGRNITVPRDPSSAAFLTVAALITKDSDLVIPQVLVNPLRLGLYDTLREMGADITFENRRPCGGEEMADLCVRSSALKGVRVPHARVPSMIDEFPVLAIAAAFAEGKTEMNGLAELRVKESDRLSAIARGLMAAGVMAEVQGDSLTVTGTGGAMVSGGCTVETGLDHRIAMSFLVMGLSAREPIAVDDGETITTSFPDFAALMNSLGARIETV